MKCKFLPSPLLMKDLHYHLPNHFLILPPTMICTTSTPAGSAGPASCQSRCGGPPSCSPLLYQGLPIFQAKRKSISSMQPRLGCLHPLTSYTSQYFFVPLIWYLIMEGRGQEMFYDDVLFPIYPSSIVQACGFLKAGSSYTHSFVSPIAPSRGKGPKN